MVGINYYLTEDGVMCIRGINRNGCFAGGLNNMRPTKAPFGIGMDCVPLYHLVDGFNRGDYALSEAGELAREKWALAQKWFRVCFPNALKRLWKHTLMLEICAVYFTLTLMVTVIDFDL